MNAVDFSRDSTSCTLLDRLPMPHARRADSECAGQSAALRAAARGAVPASFDHSYSSLFAASHLPLPQRCRAALASLRRPTAQPVA